jgi:hypothetical protein
LLLKPHPGKELLDYHLLLIRIIPSTAKKTNQPARLIFPQAGKQAFYNIL